jgi:LPS sulfotransferase NodH
MQGPATISYLICTTPRSGSTLLCEMLTETGVAGRPEEYFQQLPATGMPMTPRDYLDGLDPALIPQLEGGDAAAWVSPHYDPRRFAGYRAYVDWVLREGTTPNGVFAAKIMWPYVAGLVSRLYGGDSWNMTDAQAALERTFPSLRYVWLRRRDKVRQAVSLWRAIQTWQWRQDVERARSDRRPEPERELRYSFAAIDHLRRRLEASDLTWEVFFETMAADPMIVTYEDFVHAKQETVLAVLRHLSVPAPAAVGAPRTARMADEVSERWVHDYAAESGARMPAVR